MAINLQLLLHCILKGLIRRPSGVNLNHFRLLHSTQQIGMAAFKRKPTTQISAGVKRAKAAIEYAATTQPGIPDQNAACAN